MEIQPLPLRQRFAKRLAQLDQLAFDSQLPADLAYLHLKLVLALGQHQRAYFLYKSKEAWPQEINELIKKIRQNRFSQALKQADSLRGSEEYECIKQSIRDKIIFFIKKVYRTISLQKTCQLLQLGRKTVKEVAVRQGWRLDLQDYLHIDQEHQELQRINRIVSKLWGSL